MIDLDRLTANIDEMADAMRARGVALRPHAKTHQTIAIAQRQLASGAVGLTCATLAEAEVFADSGMPDIFIAVPMHGGPARQRQLRLLHERSRLRVGVDSEPGAEWLSEAVSGSAEPLEVLVEVDAGYGRTGVPVESVGRIADAAARLGLGVVGAFTHAGHAYDNPGLEAIHAAADSEESRLGAALAELLRHGHEAIVASAGSTPTALRSARGSVTEERPGSYVFGDRRLLMLGVMQPERLSLYVIATVISTSVAGQFVLDSGSKALGSVGAGFAPGYGLVPKYGGCVERIDEHHAMVTCAGPRPRVGDVVLVVPNSASYALALSPETLVMRKGKIIDRWRVGRVSGPEG